MVGVTGEKLKSKKIDFEAAAFGVISTGVGPARPGPWNSNHIFVDEESDWIIWTPPVVHLSCTETSKSFEMTGKFKISTKTRDGPSIGAEEGSNFTKTGLA